jgi:hypothetical protein
MGQIENLEGNNTDSITVYDDDGQHIIAIISAESQSNSMYSECLADGTLNSANVFKSNGITYYTFDNQGTVETVFRIGDTDYSVSVYDSENSTMVNVFSIGLQILSGNPSAFVNVNDVSTVSNDVSTGSTGSNSVSSGSTGSVDSSNSNGVDYSDSDGGASDHDGDGVLEDQYGNVVNENMGAHD